MRLNHVRKGAIFDSNTWASTCVERNERLSSSPSLDTPCARPMAELEPRERGDENPVPPHSPDMGGDEKPRAGSISGSSHLRRVQSLQHSVSLPREVLVIGLICLAQLTTQVSC